jgi:hypothetical protein
MTHQTIDQRSLELHSLIAEKIQRDPSLLQIAIRNSTRWLNNKTLSPSSRRCTKEWCTILKKPLKDILRTLTSESESAKRLRQSSPFGGILTTQERSNIFKKYEAFRA